MYGIHRRIEVSLKKTTIQHFNQIVAPAFCRPDKGLRVIQVLNESTVKAFDALQPSPNFPISRDMSKKHHAGE
jgi:hypothetical protein